MRCARRMKNTWLSIGSCAAGLLAARRASRAGTPGPDPRSSRAPCRRACRSRPRRCSPRAAAAPSPHIGMPNCAVICRQPSSMARSTMSSAISVSRSLTCISGSTPGEIRHRHAEQRGALELAQRLDLLLRIAPRAAVPCAHSRSRAKPARVGQLRQQPLVDQLIEQQRVRGDLRGEEIPVAAQLDQARARRAVLRSSAKYAERWPIASMIASTRRSTGSCALLRATSASSTGSSACRRRRPGSSSLRTSAEPRSSSSRRAASRAVAEAGVRQATPRAPPSPPRVSQKRPEVDAHAHRCPARRRRRCTRRKCAADARRCTASSASSASQSGAPMRKRDALACERLRRAAGGSARRRASAGGSPGAAGTA